jgi:ABC-type transport system involved in cytochrome c biogenesis permease component
MFSSTLALFIRSFRVDARSTQPHILRLLFAGIILLQLVWIHNMEVQYGAPGLTVFVWIAWLNFAVISLAGLGYFATAISEEKEEESLGLLKMAGISPAALLLGKSTTRLIAVLLMLAVEFPFVLLSITLGGVTMTQVVAMAVALAAYLVFIANLGLICSVVGSNSRRASTMMTLSLIVVLVVFPVLGEFATYWTTTHPQDTLGRRFWATFTQWEQNVSMWSRISTITTTGFSESAVSPQVLYHCVAALGFFGLSWVGFERFTRERHVVRPLARFFTRPSRWLGRRRVDRAWRMALTWKDFHFVAGGRRMLIVRFCLFFIVIGGLFWLVSLEAPQRTRFSLDVLGGTAMIAMLAAGAIELALIASRVFHEEVKAQTLPLLMMLPKTAAQIAWSKAASAIPALVPALCYFLLGAVLNSEESSKDLKGIVTSWAGWYAIVLFVLFLHTAAYLSLVVKWGALPLAIFLVYFSQMLIFPMFAALSWFFFRSGSSGEGPMFFCLITIALTVIGVLEYRIPRRLQTLAGR